MSLLKEAALQRVEFMRRNVGEPDLVLVPMNKQYEFIGEITINHHIPVIDRHDLFFYGMRVIWVDQKHFTDLSVCMSSRGLRGERPNLGKTPLKVTAK